MAALSINEIMDLAPRILKLPTKKPSHADDSELTGQDILIRYEKGEIVGVTVLHASRWLPKI